MQSLCTLLISIVNVSWRCYITPYQYDVFSFKSKESIYRLGTFVMNVYTIMQKFFDDKFTIIKVFENSSPRLTAGITLFFVSRLHYEVESVYLLYCKHLIYGHKLSKQKDAFFFTPLSGYYHHSERSLVCFGIFLACDSVKCSSNSSKIVSTYSQPKQNTPQDSESSHWIHIKFMHWRSLQTSLNVTLLIFLIDN